MVSVTAIVVAAGKAARMGLGFNKVYALLAGRPVLAHSLDALCGVEDIGSVIVVAAEGEVEACLDVTRHFDKVVDVVTGGASRQESVYEGLHSLPEDCDIVIVHDGARPCVTPSDISRVVGAVISPGEGRRCEAAILAVRSKDTLKHQNTSCADERFVDETLVREHIWAALTPQVFCAKLLRDSYDNALSTGYIGTDDASLVERLGIRVKLVEGSYDNIKITTPEDLTIAEAIMGMRQMTGYKNASGTGELPLMRVGFGYDIHRLIPGRPLVIGGVVFHHPAGLGLEGHSDADVLSHALADAVIGAVAQGDIGIHFPPGDAACAGMSSLIILQKAADLAKQSGYIVGNVDATVVCERPKLMQNAHEVRENLARSLRVRADAVSIKATTNEGVGPIGREEAIAAYAVAFLHKVVG